MFLERQVEAEKDDVGAEASEIAKPAPLVSEAGEFAHEPDCVYRMDPVGHVCFGCCSVESMKATFTPAGDAKPADTPPAGGEAKEGAAPAADGGSAPAADGGAAATPAAGDADKAQPQGANDAPAKVTSVKFTTAAGAPISIPGNTYKEMYMAVSARADLNQEGGKCKPEAPTVSVTYKPGSTDKVESCTIAVVLTIQLPEWSAKGSQPAPDQAKFTAWYNSVKAHEDKHVAAFKSGVTASTVTPTGDKDSDIDSALDQAFTKNNAAQEAVDTSPPAPLAAPGGVEKVGANDAGDGKNDARQAAADGESAAHPAADASAPASSGSGEAPKPESPSAAA